MGSSVVVNLWNATSKKWAERMQASRGYVHVATVPGGVLHIREIDDLGSTAETLDFSATPIKAATIYAVSEAATTSTINCAVICIDPPNSDVRDAWLTAADSLTSDSQRIPVFANGQPVELTFVNAAGEPAPVDYIGAKLDLGTSGDIRLFVIGVEA